MQHLCADIQIVPFSEAAGDIVAATLGDIGFEAFECTDNKLKAYIPVALFNETLLNNTLADLPIPNLHCSYTLHKMEEQDWNAEWEQNHFDPILERNFGIKLNPRMAFGSGAHETTRQIVALIFQQDLTNLRALDMGTGTGVLAIAMAMRNANEVVAIDIDSRSVENAIENIAMNGKDNITTILGDASAVHGTFHFIVANIHKNIILADLPTYVQHLTHGGTLILSGFFHDDVPEMLQATKKHGLTCLQAIQENDWAVLMLRRL